MPLDTASILIAEDEEPIRRLLTRILTDAGYTTLEADTGDHALTMLDWIPYFVPFRVRRFGLR